MYTFISFELLFRLSPYNKYGRFISSTSRCANYLFVCVSPTRTCRAMACMVRHRNSACGRSTAGPTGPRVTQMFPLPWKTSPPPLPGDVYASSLVITIIAPHFSYSDISSRPYFSPSTLGRGGSSLPSRLSSGWPRAVHGPKFQIPLPRSFVPQAIKF